MNGLERTNAMMRGEKVDRLPVHPLLMTFAAKYAGVSFKEYVTNHRVLADAQILASKDFGIDSVTICSDPCIEQADCGGAVLWFEDQPPTPDPDNALLKDKNTLYKLSTPDPLGRGRMHEYVRTIARMREKVGGELQIMGWVEGPIAEAADLRGINEIMLDLVDDPEWVKEVFEFVTNMEIEFAKAQVEAGADIIGVGDAAASLTGPRFYHDYVYPYEKRIVDAIHDMGCPVRLQICGNINSILDDVAKLAVDIIDVDYLTDLKLAREKLGPNVPVIGNMEPVKYLLDSNPEQIKAKLRECWEICGERFMVGAGCEVPPGSPYENLRALYEFSLGSV
jgi:MtaA/CmuA family methyltransferase